MAIKGMFFDAVESGGVYDRTYSASDFSSYLHNIVGNGVFPNPSTNLQVYPSSGMNIIVKAGEAWIEGHKILNTQDASFTISGSDALYARIDRVVVCCDYDGRKMDIKVKKGTPAASPAAPALTRNSSVYEMSLATINVRRAATEITAADIIDTRADSEVCGWAAGVIQQVDTSTLFNQYNAAYAAYFEDIQAQVEDFVRTLTQELKLNTYLAEYEKTETTTGNAPLVQFSPTGYSYDPSDVIFVYLNGLLAKKNTDYEIVYENNTLYIHFFYENLNNDPQDIEIRVLKTRMAIRIISAVGNGIIVSNGNNLIGG